MMNLKFAPSSFMQLLRLPFLYATSRSAHIPPLRSIPLVQENSRHVGSAVDRDPKREWVPEQRPATRWDTATSALQSVNSNQIICLVIIIYREAYRLFSYQKLKEGKAKISPAKFLSWQRAGKGCVIRWQNVPSRQKRFPASISKPGVQWPSV